MSARENSRDLPNNRKVRLTCMPKAYNYYSRKDKSLYKYPTGIWRRNGIVSMMMLRLFDAVCLVVYSSESNRVVYWHIFCFSNDVVFFYCFPSSIIITIAAMLRVFVRYLLYLLLVLCLYHGVNKELNWNWKDSLLGFILYAICYVEP